MLSYNFIYAESCVWPGFSPFQLQLSKTKPETQKLVRVIPIKGVAVSSQTVEEENQGPSFALFAVGFQCLAQKRS